MCAINGFTFKDENLAKLMNEKVIHRGPDGSNVWSEEGITFGHNRLSIIDVTDASSQPMKSGDGRYIIVYNGELYNFRELRAELRKDFGPDGFKTTGDTEVILRSYEKWGKDCVSHFNGMFAFAVWDTKTNELFLARDHAGIKPLYYCVKNGKLIFSSEIKGILVHKDVPRKVSIDSLNHYMRLLYVPEPFTMFSGIEKLPKGSTAVWKDGKLSIESYFKPKLGELKDSRKNIVKTIEQKIERAVERQLVSDRPLGIYLSGGIDSSVILDCVAKNHKNIKTFSVGFDLGSSEENEKFNRDFDIAHMTAHKYKTEHHELKLSSDDALKSFEDVVFHMDEPISNPTAWALFALSKKTREEVVVILSGDGGDELFGGYDRYRLSYIASLYQIIPRFITSSLAYFGSALRKLSKRAWVDRYGQFMFQKDKIVDRVLDKDVVNKFITKEFFENYMKGHNFEEVIMETDRKTWLVDFALMLSDTMSMAHGIEARVPLLDRDVVEYALSIPAHKKLSMFSTKKLLKEAFAKRIPEYLLKQPKRGFFTPGAKWLRHEGFLRMAKTVLSDKYYPATANLFNWKEINTILDKHVDKSEYNLSIIWALMTFQVWAKQFEVDLD